MDEPTIPDQIRLEVARRLDAILSTPDLVARYDSDHDGRLDADERDILRYVVEAAVVHELEGLPTTDEPVAAPSHSRTRKGLDAWSIADERDLPIIGLVDDRFELLKELGRGGQARTYLARSRDSGELVALKELSFEDLGDWKSLDLFRREAAVLKSLQHPSIPAFVDSFHIEHEEESPRFFLVYQFVRGDSLDVLLARGERLSEAGLITFARAMLEVLEYLHLQNPPVVHRDVKPANIVRQEGRYHLLDFGAVQLASATDEGGSTVVGTTGYMPPEQLGGRARPSSDLYALGATLVHLSTGIHPSKLPQARMKLTWREHSGLSAPLANFVDRLIEPIVEDRFPNAQSARAALDQLQGATKLATRPSTDLGFPRPPGADARIMWADTSLVVDMSRDSIAPRIICGGLGAVVGIGLAFATLNGWSVLACIALGLIVSQYWTSGPEEQLLITPDGHFRFVHVNGKTRRETSGKVRSFALDRNELHLRTDGGSLLAVGAHCNSSTRRWLFGSVDAFLRRNR